MFGKFVSIVKSIGKSNKKENTKEKVPFDPGYSKFTASFPKEAITHLEEVSKLKQNHQKKFALTNLESQVVPMIRLCASFYLGCVLWGSYLSIKFKDDAREIEGNPVFLLSEEERTKLCYNEEIELITDFINKLEKASVFYLKRSSRLNPELVPYFEIYDKFIRLNDNFINLKSTDEIKIPEEMSHFKKHNSKKLDELKQKIYEIINSEKLEGLLELGLYK